MRLGLNNYEQERKTYLNVLRDTDADYYIVHARYVLFTSLSNLPSIILTFSMPLADLISLYLETEGKIVAIRQIGMYMKNASSPLPIPPREYLQMGIYDLSKILIVLELWDYTE